MKSTVGMTAIVFMILALNGPALGQNGWEDDGSVVRLETSTDKVGIGTTSPYEKLVVMNQSVFGGNINAPGGEPITVTGSSAGISYQARNGGTDRFVIYNTNGYLRFWEGGDRMALAQNTGYLGIGTTSPKNKLDVEGAAVIGASYSGTNTAPANGLLVEGNVGIGTTGPGAKLEVAGDLFLSMGADRTIKIPISTWGGNSLTIKAGDSFNNSDIEGGHLYLFGGTGDDIGSGADGGDVYLAGGTSPGGDGDVILAHTGSTPRGRVGIGTTSPQAQLDVNGTTRTKVIEITGGSDLAEPFEVTGETTV